MKEAKKYLDVDPWKIIETGFYPEHSEVSESLFSLGNEYMGARGYFEEGYSGKSLRGCFFNGIYEKEHIGHPHWFKGIVTEGHFMVNAADCLFTSISANGEKLDLAKSRFKNFTRVLNLYTGVLHRSFTWITNSGGEITVSFERFISMTHHHNAAQKIEITTHDFEGEIEFEAGVDFSTVHQAFGQCFWKITEKDSYEDTCYIIGETIETKQRLCSAFIVSSTVDYPYIIKKGEKAITKEFIFKLKKGESVTFEKSVYNYTSKNESESNDSLKKKACGEMTGSKEYQYDTLKAGNENYWADIWKTADIEIEGDDENQQGIRFCIFNLIQTYHGISPDYGISAKGLTGEIYSGWTWWDTETYCLPFYMFNLPNAARNLLLYRYRTLPQAIERAEQLDCEGARYPMATINGKEAVGTWQHGDLEIHVSVAVAFGIWHYMKLTNDKAFLYTQGIEMLLQISRYYAKRGQWGQKTGDFGFFGVMGPDEFAMMVHNNFYTNAMVKKCFEYTLHVVAMIKGEVPKKLAEVEKKVGIRPDEYMDWAHKAEKMRLNVDSETGIYEQYDGYFNMPHVDVSQIPDSDFPLYKNWAYVRIFRNDMLKQPDVLLMHLFYSKDYSLDNKRVNFEFYEKRCSHESSLSPAIHSILASELGMNKKAYNYARHASRLDLDNYNNNTHEGIHNTSMAAAWMNIVYGFAGLRTDGDILSFKPSIPAKWERYAFKLNYKNRIINISIDKEHACFTIEKGDELTIDVNEKLIKVDQKNIKISLKNA